jgi:hypothetical protein
MLTKKLLLNYAGIVGVVFAFLFISFSFVILLSKYSNIVVGAISDLGVYKETSFLFTTTIFISATLCGIFLYTFFDRFHIKSILIKVISFFAYFLLVGIGIFNYRDFSNLHRWLAFFYAVLFLVILILIIRKIHKVLAYRLASIVLLVVYFLLLLILCLLYILNWKNPNILVPEIALFLIQGIWIVLSSVVMIVLKRRKV